jgi:hypothetical protein
MTFRPAVPASVVLASGGKLNLIHCGFLSFR